MIDVSERKAKLRAMLDTDKTLAVVGRIATWLENSESRFPVSCTVLQVEDSMEGENGIEYSWLYVSKGLRYAAGVAVDVSKLRPAGTDNGKGLVSSGAASFATIYSMLNSVLRRGGTYKNGAVVVYLDAFHPDVWSVPTRENNYTTGFLNLAPQEIPWIKRALYVDDNPESPEYLMKHPHLDEILRQMRAGNIFLAKKRWYHPELKRTVNYPPNPNDPQEHRLLSQVCLEILLRSNATCLLAHSNMGQWYYNFATGENNFSQAMCSVMELICQTHPITGAGKDNYYRSPDNDKQVGVGVLGLANFLAIHRIKYKEFADMLFDYMTVTETHFKEDKTKWSVYTSALSKLQQANPTVYAVVAELYLAFQEAAKVARSYGMERAFTIAPTASCSYRYKDFDGYTTTPEISPPICHPVTKSTTRDSTTFGAKEYFYHPDVETAEQVGFATYYKLVKAWQMLMNSTGLAHSISFNVWDECPIDHEWIEDWLQSPIVTTYYRMQVRQAYVDKTNISMDLGEFNLADDFFIPEDTTEDSEADSFLSIFGKAAKSKTDDSVPTSGFCNSGPEGECISCAE